MAPQQTSSMKQDYRDLSVSQKKNVIDWPQGRGRQMGLDPHKALYWLTQLQGRKRNEGIPLCVQGTFTNNKHSPRRLTPGSLPLYPQRCVTSSSRSVQLQVHHLSTLNGVWLLAQAVFNSRFTTSLPPRVCEF